MKLKTDFARAQFPAFSSSALKRWAHFENAGGSYMAGQVKEIYDRYFVQSRVQPYHPFQAAKAAGAAMDRGYAVAAELMNVPEDWVYLGASSSYNTYVLAEAFRPKLGKGKNIIVTNQDHEANTGFWRRLADTGVEIREWSVDQNGILQIADLEPLIDSNTVFAAFPHVSNIVGMINPVAEITELLRGKNVISIVDGVSYVPHAWPDVAALGADIYFFSAYKTYGPHLGVMAIRPEVADDLPCQGHGFNDGERRKRLNPAGPDHANIAAMAGVGDYVEALYKRHFKEDATLGEAARAVSNLQRKHESKHLESLIETARELKSFRLIGPDDCETRVPTVSLYHDSRNGASLAKELSKHQIMAAGGHFYAPRVLEAMGLDPERGVLRLSFVHYTKGKEVETLCKALKKLDG